MELQELEDLIRKYNAGLATPEEQASLESWYEQAGGKSHMFDDPDIRNGAKVRLQSSLENYTNQEPDSFQKSLALKKTLLRYVVAASIVGIMVIVGIKWLSETDKNKEKNSADIASVNHHKARTIPALRTIENNTRHVVIESLPDGSRVTMYPASVLRYLPAFDKDTRKVFLDGKAVFKVSKDQSRPFTVYAGGIATTALGTLFMVTELPGRNVSVALMEGSIKVWPEHSTKNEFVVLQAGDKLVVNSNRFNNYTLEKKARKNIHTPGHQEIAATTANETNSMVFKNDRLKEVFKKISEKFYITINYEGVPGIEKESFTGVFLENDSLEFICTTICDLHGYQYRKEGNILTISKR